MTDANNSANVRKKGRPRVMDEEMVQFLKEQGAAAPNESYRSTYTGMRTGVVQLALIASCGEKMHVHPKTAERYPWLMGEKVQMSVLAELHGLPDGAIVAAATAIEQIRRERPLNAKEGRKVARFFKRAIRAGELTRTAVGSTK
jgi:hypothetical protein